MDPLRDGDPREIGSYRLEGRLGAGGMGEVFLGRSRGGRPVAVKLVRPELAGDPKFRRRFAREVANARRVGGVYTAEVVDADPEGDPPWLVTAYVPGPSLRAAVDGGAPLPPEAIAPFGAALVEGLAAVHDAKVVHGDLTPGNVILAGDGPRLIDFGIAHALDATTVSITIGGTPGFMSPEQAKGHELDPRSDVFSLGAVLCYAATGRSPFGTGRAEAVVYRIVHDEPDLTGVTAELSGLVAACLQKEPAARPGLPELLDVLTGLAGTAGPRAADGSTGGPGRGPGGTRVDHDAAYDTVRDDDRTEARPPPATTRVAPETAVFALDARTVRTAYGKAWAVGAGMFMAIMLALVVVLLIGDLIKTDGASSDDVLPVLTVFIGGGLLVTLLFGLIGLAVAPRPHRLTLDPGGLSVEGPRGSLALDWDGIRHVTMFQAKVVAWFPKDDQRMRRLAKRHRLERSPLNSFPAESLVGYVVYNSAPASLSPDDSERIPPVRSALIRMAGDRYATP